MKIFFKIKIAFLFIILFSGCKEYSTDENIVRKLDDSKLFLKTVKKLSDIIVHDIFSPPVASRVYVYPCIAAYETLCIKDTNRISLVGQLHGLDKLKHPKIKNASLELAAIYAFIEVSKSLIFSEEKMLEHEHFLEEKLDLLKISKNIRNNSKKYAYKIAKQIIDWAANDNYNKSRSYPKYTVNDEVGRWKPTPPAYMDGIEPHWNKIRTMVLDSASQFKPKQAPEFDMESGSKFHQLVMEVYDVRNKITEEQVEIASFWDCNPYVMNTVGHVMFATKKITPGGHWMGIARIACENINANLMQSIEISTWVSITLFDAFISCWDEKYRSNLIRPETVINEYISTDWKPVLQTPPFPEHTSGHSVISMASAVVLTNLLGDDFSFRDDVELEYGLPVRNFSSFIGAANEAAISRLYGGIHYLPAIEDGVQQGKFVGNHIVSRIKTKK